MRHRSAIDSRQRDALPRAVRGPVKEGLAWTLTLERLLADPKRPCVATSSSVYDRRIQTVALQSCCRIAGNVKAPNLLADGPHGAALRRSVLPASRNRLAAARDVSPTIDQSLCHQQITDSASLRVRAASTSATSQRTSFHQVSPSPSAAPASIAERLAANATPLMSALFASVLLSTPLSGTFLIGAGMVAAGSLLAALGART